MVGVTRGVARPVGGGRGGCGPGRFGGASDLVWVGGGWPLVLQGDVRHRRNALHSKPCIPSWIVMNSWRQACAPLPLLSVPQAAKQNTDDRAAVPYGPRNL